MRDLVEGYADYHEADGPGHSPPLQFKGKFIGLLEGVFKDGRLILAAVAVTLAATIVADSLVTPRYVAEAELLVLPSSIYSPQPDVGGAPPPSTMLDRDTYLKNEVEILSSATLAEEVIRKIGLPRIYPNFPVPVGPGTATTDRVVRAATRFGRDFRAIADKTGNIIVVSFKNRNPSVAALTVNTAVALYLRKRGELYDDNQSWVVAQHVDEQRTRLDDAEKAYAAFIAHHGISSFETQMDILLHQEGDITHDLGQGDSDAEQGTKRLSTLRSEMSKIPAQTVMYSETNQLAQIESLRNSLENLRAQESGLAVYDADNNPVLMALRGQIKASEASLRRLRSDGPAADVRTGRNPVLDTLEVDVVHAQQDLQGALARHNADMARMKDVRNAIATLQAQQPEFLQLRRERDLAVASYQSIVRTLDERRITESAGLSRSANVRVVQTAEVPMVTSKLRLLILAAGVMLSVFAGLAVAVLCEVFRRGYISPEKLEHSLGIPVLTIVRDFSALPLPRAVFGE